MSKRKLTGRPSLFLSARLSSSTLGAIPAEPDPRSALFPLAYWPYADRHQVDVVIGAAALMPVRPGWLWDRFTL
jgi:hypothetical protein